MGRNLSGSRESSTFGGRFLSKGQWFGRSRSRRGDFSGDTLNSLLVLNMLCFQSCLDDEFEYVSSMVWNHQCQFWRFGEQKWPSGHQVKKRPVRWFLGDPGMYKGFDLAVRTMKPKERAIFEARELEPVVGVGSQLLYVFLVVVVVVVLVVVILFFYTFSDLFLSLFLFAFMLLGKTTMSSAKNIWIQQGKGIENRSKKDPELPFGLLFFFADSSREAWDDGCFEVDQPMLAASVEKFYEVQSLRTNGLGTGTASGVLYNWKWLKM